MANKHATLKALFTDTADAIRGKSGDSATIVADAFPDTIRGITGAFPAEGEALYPISQIEPKQAGSGDPSPSNPRAISGWTGAKLTRSNGEKSDDFTVQFGQTVYGGTYDWTKGELTIDRRIVEFDGTETWRMEKTFDKKTMRAFYRDTEQPTPKLSPWAERPTANATRPGWAKASSYAIVSASNTWGSIGYKDGVGIQANEYVITVLDSRFKDETSPQKFTDFLKKLKADGTPLQVVFAVKPEYQQVIKLTPQEILALAGENHVLCDTGRTDTFLLMESL